MTVNKLLRIRAMEGSIKMVEDRVADLIRDIKNESNVRVKMLMQSSLRVNKEVLEELKKEYNELKESNT